MTVFHFIRHGQVENPGDIYYGRLPGFPLSDEGRQSILYLGQQLAHQSHALFSTIYTSPLLRTTQSAALLAELLNLPVEQDNRLIEIATFFEGKAKGAASSVQHYPPEQAGYAETMAEIYQRMATFVHDIALLHPHQHVIALTHGGPIRLLEMGIEGQPFTDWAYNNQPIPDYASMTLVTVDNDHLSVERAEAS